MLQKRLCELLPKSGGIAVIADSQLKEVMRVHETAHHSAQTFTTSRRSSRRVSRHRGGGIRQGLGEGRRGQQRFRGVRQDHGFGG
jgi:hypothetical protein